MFPSDTLGPYDVGVIQRRIPDSTACQIFYPAVRESNNDTTATLPYWRHRAVVGLTDYLGRGNSSLLEFLEYRNNPCLVNAEPKEQKEDGYPVVVFSHGLGGCFEMYSELCREIASFGMVVLALEHEDGSGCYAKNSKGKEIFYKKPKPSPYSRSFVVNFRRPFLKQRVKEIENVMTFLLSKKKQEKELKEEKVLSRILETADISKGLALLGHSFGGASMVLVAQKESPTKGRINSLTTLDTWAFSMEDEALQKGIPPGSLSILSEGWLPHNNIETEQIMKMHASGTSSLYYMPNSIHASISDVSSWLPSIISRQMNLRGQGENRHETIRACASACVNHITRSIKGEHTILNDKDYEPLLPVRSKDKSSVVETESESSVTVD